MKRRKKPREVARPGEAGRLSVRADLAGEEVRLEGDYRYVGVLGNDMLAFIPLGKDEPIYVHHYEVVSFKAAP